ncbi:MAG: type II toxin-antitoxin system RelE/ParE family toxin [Candidatus Hydrogenedentes bacterium]|nr:type II toxin-antitoxin system RelE/ParE family toxin [Candidatus Hydrogenedentota bacterium]MBI3117532.1 type II toxin-antitoxin system RelE/ParE family toxin [Candidatus Hydrogenedentota bacterium]
MVRSFRNKGLERFFEEGVISGIQAHHAERLRLILGRLNAATQPRDMNLPGLHLHELTGSRKGTWSVRVSGNWRVTFRFVEQEAVGVDYEDYH